jgi:hypothetical protein
LVGINAENSERVKAKRTIAMSANDHSMAEAFDDVVDGMIDGMVDEMMDGMVDGMMDGTVDGTMDGFVDGIANGTGTNVGGEETPVTDQRILSLLYLIAEDYARRSGYVHRGVTCNSCGASPIRGARYHCTECADVDLCQFCERAKRHDPYHILVKSKVPIPVTLGPRWVQQSWRPRSARNARNIDIPERLDAVVTDNYAATYHMTPSEVGAAWQCFRPLADVALSENIAGCALSRKSLCQALVPRSPTGLMAERIFAVYDIDHDGLVRFDDVLRMRAAETDIDLKLYYGLMALDVSGTGRISHRDARDVLNSVAENSKDLAVDLSADQFYQRSLAHFVPNDSRPLSTFFRAHVTPGDSYPPKPQAMATTASPIVYLQREYGTNLSVSRHSRVFGQLSDLQLTYGTRTSIGDALTTLSGGERYDLDSIRQLPVQSKLDRAGLCDWLFVNIL